MIPGLQEDYHSLPLQDLSRSDGSGQTLVVPLLTRGSAIGLIALPGRDAQTVFSQKDRELAEIIASQIAAVIDKSQLFARTENALDLAESDLEIGKQIQSGFFPDRLPDIPGWEIATHFKSARQVAGDFYDAFQFKNSRLTAIIIADVCDKGVGAALFMVLFRSLLRAFSEVQVGPADVKDKLKQIIQSTNDYVATIHASSNMFATVFFGVLDPDSGTLTYVNGGHLPPAILDQEGKIINRLMPTGPAIGLFPGKNYQVEQVSLAKGDFLVGFTDGVTDATDRSTRSFSEERLLNYIQVPWTSLFSMIFELKSELTNHMDGETQFDDIALISIRRKLTSDLEKHAICRPAELVALDELRDFVDSASLQCKLNQEDALAFKIATQEVCTNIIQHGFEGRQPGVISLFFENDPIKTRLIIRDDGQFFSPDQPGSLRTGQGLPAQEYGNPGLMTFTGLMDHVSYARMNGKGNQLILEKKMGKQLH
jgi:serine phosphatase RsbU (regulator of sigma subunit)/anti-sigma regulatory factor (Ser/Thr protein kinase)